MSNYTFKFIYYYLMSIAILLTGVTLVSSATADSNMEQEFSGSGAVEDSMIDHVPEVPRPPVTTQPELVKHEDNMGLHAMDMLHTPTEATAHAPEPILTTSHAMTPEMASGEPEEEGEQVIGGNAQHEEVLEQLHIIKRKIKSLKRYVGYEFKRLHKKLEAHLQSNITQK